MTCPLCERAEQVRRSHVIPEFLFKPGYDDKHRLIKTEKGIPAKQFLQKGIRVPLLCDDCVQFLNKHYETPVATLWDTWIPNAVSESDLLLQDPNYDLIKLFHLSILWRAGISNHRPFGSLRLGAKHESALRRMIREADPGDPSDYPIFGYVIVDPRTRAPLKGTAFSPITNKIANHHVHTFMYGGCAWHFAVSSHAVGPLDDRVLGVSDSWRLPVRLMTEFRPFDEGMRSHIQSIRARKSRL